MSERLYPFGYGTRLVTIDVLEASLKPHHHPEVLRRVMNFIRHQGGKFGIGSSFRATGAQPDRPGFAPEGKSFHQRQRFPSGSWVTAIDWVVVNPGYVHRAPRWEEVPAQGQALSLQYGYHMNVGTPGSKGAESWHGQPIELDDWESWVAAGRPDIQANYPIVLWEPRPQPPQPPVPPTQPTTRGITVQFTSRHLKQGATGNDVKFFQRQLNDIAGQGLLLDGSYGAKTTSAVRNWQGFFKKTSSVELLTVNGELDALTQQSIVEVSLLSA
jgi:hypothetical protein